MKMEPVEILYEDNHLLFAYKPHGLATQPTPLTQESLEKRLKDVLKIRDKKPGNVYLHAVHRLDKPASGVVLFAKTQKALSRLHEAMRQGNIQKKYIAQVEGILFPKEETLELFLVHGDHKAIVSTVSNPQAKKSILSYKVIKETEKSSFVEVILTTGRYHQIRATFGSIGHPIIGDYLYGSQKEYLPGAIALTHSCLSITHPVTKELVCVTCSA